MDQLMNSLLDPPFAKDPPVKLDIPAKTLGLVYAIVGAIFALFGLSGVLGLLGLSALSSVTVIGSVFLLVAIGALISEAGTIVIAWGGYQMYQAKRAGKKIVVYGLLIGVAGSLVTAVGSFGTGLPGWIVGVGVTFVLYYLVIVSRFEEQPKPA